tara:strand:+ start:443 stop:619 length:177 start_codon:yes stop_codon:yes gene_type:complete
MPNGDHPTPIENVVFFIFYMIIGFIVFSSIGKLSISIGVVITLLSLFIVFLQNIFKEK